MTTGVPDPAAGVLRLGVAQLDTLDPAAVVVTQPRQMIAIDLLYDGLTAIDPDTMEAVPSLAEFSSNDDLTEWTFTISDDAVFSDGSPVTADDVKFSLERIAAQGAASLAGVRLEVIEGYAEFIAGDADGISGISAADDGTVVITTAEPYAMLPELLASPVFGVLPDAADDTDGFFDAPIGSGPLAYDANEDGVMSLVVTEGADLQIDGVDLVQFDSEADAYEAFTAGDVDWSLVPTDEAAAAAEEYGDDNVTPFHAVLFYGINVGNPKYADQDFRQAIVQAVDREALAALVPGGQLLNGLIPEGVPGHRDDVCGEACTYDPEAAQELLATAFPSGDIPTVNLDYFESTGSDSAVADAIEASAEAVKADLEAVGITVELQPKPFEEYSAFVTSSEQELFLFGWPGISPTADSFISPLFLTDSADNVTAFGSDIVDAGIAAARAFPNRDDQIEAFQAVEDSLMSALPLMPFVQFETVAVVGDAVEGFTPQLDGTFVVERVVVTR